MYDGGESKQVNNSAPMPGLYRARVEYNMDPLKVGRVKIRVPQMHGMPGEGVESSELPWASMCAFSEAGDDYGDFMIPEVGSTVFIIFEGGDTNKPVYIGSPISRDSESSKPYNKVGDEPKFTKKYGDTPWGGTPGNIESPGDAHKHLPPTDFEITRKVLYKSPKGASIQIEEDDEKEFTKVTDRVGQVVSLISPITKAKNKGNESKRGVRSSDKDNPIDYSPSEGRLLGSKAVILMKDAAFQLVRMVAEFGKEKIEVMSRNRPCKDELVWKRNSGAVFKSYAGDTRFQLIAEQRDVHSGNRVMIDGSADGSSVVITVGSGGTLGAKVHISGGKVSIDTSGEIKLTSGGDISLNSGGDVNLNANGNLNVNVVEVSTSQEWPMAGIAQTAGEANPAVVSVPSPSPGGGSPPPESGPFKDIWSDSKDESWAD